MTRRRRIRRPHVIALAATAFVTAATGVAVQAASSAGTEVGQAVVDAARGAVPALPTPRSRSSACHMRGSGPTALPDPRCTPGATDPRVTPATIRTTICAPHVSGVPTWADKVRPPTSVTNRIKAERMKAYGVTLPTSAVELDHSVQEALGGAPGAKKVGRRWEIDAGSPNLWPQPDPAPNLKDKVEAAALAAVCRKGRDLRLTQRQMGSDWIALGRALGVKGLPAGRAS